MLVLDADAEAIAAEAARTATASAWARVIREGDDLAMIDALRAVRANAQADDEWAVAVACSGCDRSIARAMTSVRADVAEAASEAYAACVKAAPLGVGFPSFGRAAAASFVVARTGSAAAPLTLRLRLGREDGLTRSVSGMVWHSSVALGRFLSRAETRAWTRAFAGRRCLEIGGGTSIAGMTFAAQCPDWDVTLTDVDAAAVANTAYNAKKQTQYLDAFARTAARVLDWDDDDEFHEEHANSFDVIIGADVVHEEHMAPGVVRALKRYLAPGGCALIVNPVPASRSGAQTFQNLLDEESWNVQRCLITSPIICVGMEEECEDVPLELYVIRDGDAAALPPLDVLK